MCTEETVSQVIANFYSEFSIVPFIITDTDSCQSVKSYTLYPSDICLDTARVQCNVGVPTVIEYSSGSCGGDATSSIRDPTLCYDGSSVFSCYDPTLKQIEAIYSDSQCTQVQYTQVNLESGCVTPISDCVAVNGVYKKSSCKY